MIFSVQRKFQTWNISCCCHGNSPMTLCDSPPIFRVIYVTVFPKSWNADDQIRIVVGIWGERQKPWDIYQLRGIRKLKIRSLSFAQEYNYSACIQVIAVEKETQHEDKFVSLNYKTKYMSGLHTLFYSDITTVVIPLLLFEQICLVYFLWVICLLTMLLLV